MNKTPLNILYAALAMSIVVVLGVVFLLIYFLVWKRDGANPVQGNVALSPQPGQAIGGSFFVQDPVTNRFAASPYPVMTSCQVGDTCTTANS